MGMKPCKTCGNMVSTNANKCPHCGENNPTFNFDELSTPGKVAYAGGVSIITIFTVIFAIILFIFILMFC